MLINDKALAAAMKKCKSGVKIRYYSGRLEVLCDDWYAAVNVAAVEEKPKLTLAAMVEMLGYIPEGDCLEIKKREGEYDAQELLDSAFGSEVTCLMPEPDAVSVERIPLAYGETLLLQTRDLRVVGMKPDVLRVCAFLINSTYSERASTFSCKDEDSKFLCRAWRRDNPCWKALESIRWGPEKEAEQATAGDAEDDGQMEMGDSDE